MIYDSFNMVHLYASLHPEMDEAVNFLKAAMEEPPGPGRYDIGSGNLFVNVSAYETKIYDNQLFEAHQQYIDFQVILRGEERIGYLPLQESTVETEYSAQGDVSWHSGQSRLWIPLLENTFAALFPHEGHLPSIAVDEPKQVIKAVLKIPYTG